MPQLYSRMDDSSWLTPSIADILDQGAAPPGGNGTIRQQMLQLQSELSQHGTPTRIINVRPTPAYTLFVARLGATDQNKQVITATEIRRSLAKIAESHPDWTLGFIPQLHDTDDAVGILLRTEEHESLSLRRLLVRSTFRNHPSTLAVTIGNTLEQQLIVRDLADSGQLLVIGTDRAKQNFIRSLLLTLLLLNTPGELRLALGGKSSEAYKPLINTPHALGRLLTVSDDIKRLLDGLVKEVQRRKNWFNDQNVADLTAYNISIKESGNPPLPYIIFVIDSLSDMDWQRASETWLPTLMKLLEHGKETGIYFILTANQSEDLPQALVKQMMTQIFIRSAATPKITENLDNFHGSLMTFIDAFLKDCRDEGAPVTPVEVCAVSNEEIYRAVTYWRQAAKQRYQGEQLSQVSGETGVTSILKGPKSPEKPPSPPVPEKPQADVLKRAAQMLSSTIKKRLEVQRPPPAKIPEPVETQETPAPAAPPTPAPVAQTNGATARAKVVDIDQPNLVGRAAALAAYLGWISIGPLHDILGLSFDEAKAMIKELKEQGIVENSDFPTPRFLRLQPNPFPEETH